MASRFSSLTNLVLLSAAALLLVHASARNLQQTQDFPLHGAATSPTNAESPTVTAPLDDSKNFIFGGAAGGVGGFMGMPGAGVGGGPGLTLPLPSGTPLLGGLGGLGGAMGLPGDGPIGGGSFPGSRVTPPGGFRDQPKRGFESVTYMLQGGIIHQDFTGYKDTIHEGDVHWRRAGRGIILSERPAEGFTNGLTIGINLPSTYKMIKPANLKISSCNIPRAEKNGVEVKVIAGSSMGVQSTYHTKTPIMFLDFTLKPRSLTIQTVPETWSAFAYVIEGDEGVFSSLGSSTVHAHTVVVFGPGDQVCVRNTSRSRSLRFLLIAGEPIGEPVVQKGPFVMNSQAEIDTAFGDYCNAKNGFELAKSWSSDWKKNSYQ
ncbi:unnamed protein product [Microthlaspi erraticum]|uniref:Pirin C-terminal domain-containing protein n=1 Tax=Microthlaspi erraticum TaxID=1685480 RepID=A0A6D2JST6_9BRAS|nr:unnamed protein product [Microthlaspi erraticum]